MCGYDCVAAGLRPARPGRRPGPTRTYRRAVVWLRVFGPQDRVEDPVPHEPIELLSGCGSPTRKTRVEDPVPHEPIEEMLRGCGSSTRKTGLKTRSHTSL